MAEGRPAPPTGPRPARTRQPVESRGIANQETATDQLGARHRSPGNTQEKELLGRASGPEEFAGCRWRRAGRPVRLQSPWPPWAHPVTDAGRAQGLDGPATARAAARTTARRTGVASSVRENLSSGASGGCGRARGPGRIVPATPERRRRVGSGDGPAGVRQAAGPKRRSMVHSGRVRHVARAIRMDGATPSCSGWPRRCAGPRAGAGHGLRGRQGPGPEQTLHGGARAASSAGRWSASSSARWAARRDGERLHGTGPGPMAGGSRAGFRVTEGVGVFGSVGGSARCAGRVTTGARLDLAGFTLEKDGTR